MAFILATVYRSNLVAMLVKPLLNLPFNSLESLAKTDAKIYGYSDTRFMIALANAEEGTTFASVKKNFLFNMSAEVGARGYHQRKWGLTSSKTTLKYALHLDFSLKGRCTYYPIKQGIFQTSQVSYAFPKGSILKTRVDPIIRRLRESGIIDYLVNRRIPNATECLSQIDSGLSELKRPLAIQDLSAAFFILLAGRTEMRQCITRSEEGTFGSDDDDDDDDEDDDYDDDDDDFRHCILFPKEFEIFLKQIEVF
ncbi:glutamate receptor 4-like [Macrobrachium nipponense]|uniref:glutamate receptor 4-like n=1 Tax=Macrobrachium nipponense TaxID=159736 RepID=UPI0030C87135